LRYEILIIERCWLDWTTISLHNCIERMKIFNIKAMIGDTELPFTINEESTSGSYVVTKDQKFLARIFKDVDGSWKTYEVSDLNPSDINTIGEEIEIYLKGER
jgi:hypothetical protein